MVLLLGPRVGEEHVYRPRVVLGKKIMESIQGLESDHAGIGYSAAAALSGERADSLQHALYPQELAIGVRERAAAQELPLAAADLYLKRTRQIYFKRSAGIGNSNDWFCHLPEENGVRQPVYGQGV